ncbi:MAG TPA: hypothetical protein VD838_07095, partial [Anaeromyxobacteraceae bacterium]|nr:hypothetical protein [Anaeromyxobacteraceae bacterium]
VTTTDALEATNHEIADRLTYVHPPSPKRPVGCARPERARPAVIGFGLRPKHGLVHDLVELPKSVA